MSHLYLQSFVVLKKVKLFIFITVDGIFIVTYIDAHAFKPIFIKTLGETIIAFYLYYIF